MLAKRMQVVFCLQVRLMRFLGRGVQANPNGLVINLDFGKPFAVLCAYARKAAFVVLAFAVLCVLGVRCLAQIGNSVVSTVTVNMVKLMLGPSAMHIQPRKPVSRVQDVIQSDANVPVSHTASGFVARATTAARLVPCKNAGVGSVVHKFPQTGLGHLIGVHDLNNIKQVAWCQP